MTKKEMSKKTREEILKMMDNIPYTHYTTHNFKDPIEKEKMKALNCTDSRVEELRNRAKQRLIIREILEQGD